MAGNDENSCCCDGAIRNPHCPVHGLGLGQPEQQQTEQREVGLGRRQPAWVPPGVTIDFGVIGGAGPVSVCTSPLGSVCKRVDCPVHGLGLAPFGESTLEILLGGGGPSAGNPDAGNPDAGNPNDEDGASWASSRDAVTADGFMKALKHSLNFQVGDRMVSIIVTGREPLVELDADTMFTIGIAAQKVLESVAKQRRGKHFERCPNPHCRMLLGCCAICGGSGGSWQYGDAPRGNEPGGSETGGVA